MAQPLAVGTVEYLVVEADLASTLALSPGDHYPAVFATTRMIGLMEIAAARALVPLLAPGQLSVGAHVDVAHTAATPPGATVVAEARYLRAEGKLHVFEVTARDEGGEIGRGLHKRAIVDAARIEASSRRRSMARS